MRMAEYGGFSKTDKKLRNRPSERNIERDASSARSEDIYGLISAPCEPCRCRGENNKW